MISNRAASLLFLRLQLAAPEGRVYLVTAPGKEPACETVAGELVKVMEAAGHCTMSHSLAGRQVSADTRKETPAPGEGSEGTRLDGNYRVHFAGGLLDSPDVLAATAASDAVILVARRGRTTRADLAEARRDIARVGASLAAAVLIE